MSQNQEAQNNDHPVSVVEESFEISFSQRGDLDDFLDSVKDTEEKEDKLSAQNHIVLSSCVSECW